MPHVQPRRKADVGGLVCRRGNLHIRFADRVGEASEGLAGAANAKDGQDMIRIFGRHLHFSDNPWAGAPAWAIELGLIGLHILSTLEKDDMATKETLDALTASVKANTDATAAAKQALEGYAKSNADLTAQLKAAVAASDAADDADVKAAVDAITANNAALTAAAPSVAQAVVAGTPAATPPA